MTRIGLAAGVVFILGFIVTAGAVEARLREGETVTLKLPSVFLSKGGSGLKGLLDSRQAFVVDIVEDGGRVSPLGSPQWRLEDFPSLEEFTVAKIRQKED